MKESFSHLTRLADLFINDVESCVFSNSSTSLFKDVYVSILISSQIGVSTMNLFLPCVRIHKMKKNTERAGGEHKCLFAGGNSARGNSAGGGSARGSSARGSSANTGGRRRHRHRLHLFFQNAFSKISKQAENSQIESREFCAAKTRI